MEHPFDLYVLDSNWSQGLDDVMTENLFHGQYTAHVMINIYFKTQST